MLADPCMATWDYFKCMATAGCGWCSSNPMPRCLQGDGRGTPVHQDQCAGYRYIQLFTHGFTARSFLQTNEEKSTDADLVHTLQQDIDPFDNSGVVHDPQTASLRLAKGQSVVVPKDEASDILKMLDYEKMPQ